MHSLSYFKKRTAALNKAYGTHYSPKQLLELEQRGSRSPLLASIKALPDPRATRSAEQVSRVYESTAAYQLRETFSALASRNATVNNWVNSIGHYTTSDRKFIYFEKDGRWHKVNVKTNAEQVLKGKPRTALTKIDAKIAYEQIRKKAEELHKKREEDPLASYYYD